MLKNSKGQKGCHAPPFCPFCLCWSFRPSFASWQQVVQDLSIVRGQGCAWPAACALLGFRGTVGAQNFGEKRASDVYLIGGKGSGETTCGRKRAKETGGSVAALRITTASLTVGTSAGANACSSGTEFCLLPGSRRVNCEIQRDGVKKSMKKTAFLAR